MVITSWLSFLNPFQPNKPRRAKQPKRTLALPKVASGEQLETRVLPAATLNIVVGASGTGDQDANLLADGQINFADPDIGSNTLSTGALLALASTTDVFIGAQQINFADLGASALILATGSGHSVTFSTDTAGGTSITFADPTDVFSTTGANLDFEGGTNVSLSNLDTQGGDVTVNAGLQAAGNIVAHKILTGGSGNLVFNADGTIDQSDAAVGLAVNATATGNIVFDSLRGTTVSVTSNTGSISSLGTNAYQASVQLTMSAATGINAVTLAPQLQASNSTSGDIVLAQKATPPTALTIVGSGVVNSAAGGLVTITNPGSSITLNSTVSANNGNVSIQATGGVLTLNNIGVTSGGGSVSFGGRDGIVLTGSAADVDTNGGIFTANADTNADGVGTYTQDNAGSTVTTSGAAATITAADVGLTGMIDAGAGIVTIQNSSSGKTINIGTNTAGSLSLTQAELDNITGLAIRIGSSTAGLVTVSAAGINPTNSTTLHLIGGTAGITESGAGSITESNLAITSAGTVTMNNNNDVDNFAASITGAANTLTFQDQDGFAVGIVDGVTGVTTNDGNVTLLADALDVTQAIDAGTAIVTLAPYTAATAIDVGTETGGSLSLTDTELDLVTAGVLRIGSATSGALSITAAVDPALTDTVTLRGNSINDGAAGSIVVANLAAISAGAITLDNAGNDLDTFAAFGTAVIVSDPNSLTIDTVDGQSGVTSTAADALITTANDLTINEAVSAAGNDIVLTVGGAATQGASGTVAASGLQLLGAGSFTLTNTGNNVGFIASTGTGAVEYVDADALSVATVNATNGMTTATSPISVSTVDGSLLVLQAIDAGTSTVSLTAGSNANDNTLVVNATVDGDAGVSLVADNMAITAAVTSTGGSVTAQPFEDGTLINLGGADGAGTLGLTDAEVDLLNGTSVIIGNSNAGDLTITNAITPAGTAQLELVTGGAIVDGNGGTDLTVANLAMTAGTGIGVADAIDTAVSNLEAVTDTGDLNIDNTGALSIGGITGGIDGVSTTTSGNISIVNNASITIDQEGVSGIGTVSITANGATSDISTGGGINAVTSGGLTLLSAGRDLLLGTGGDYGDIEASGNLTLLAGRDIIVDEDSHVNSHGAASITATAAGDIILQQTTNNGAQIRSEGGSITLSTGAGGTFVANGDGLGIDSTRNGGNGNITINADDVILIDTITAGTGIVTIQQVTGAVAIDLGTNSGGNLGLTDAELDQISASVLRIGNTGFAGNIDFSAPITGTSYTTLSLRTGGAVTDSNGAADFTGDSLAIQSAGAMSLETVVSNLALTNSVGAVTISNTGALDVTDVDGVSGATNTGGLLTITAASPLTISSPVSAAGDVNLGAGESAGAGDDLTIDATVTSTGGSVFLDAGDTVAVNAAVSAMTSGETIQITGGSSDTDGLGGVTLDAALNTLDTTPSLLGGAGVDTFNINVVDGANVAANGISVDGLAGNDIYNIDFSAGPINGDIDIADTAGADDELNITGANTDETVNYESDIATPLVSVGAIGITFVGIEAVSIDAQGLTGDVLNIAEDVPGFCVDDPQPLTVATAIPLTINNFETVTVENTDPTLQNLAVTASNEGGTATLSGEIVDAENHFGQTFVVHVLWGDGSPEETYNITYTANPTAFGGITHSYVDDDPTLTPSDAYTLTVWVTDDNCADSIDYAPTATVNNVAPTIDSLNVVGSPVNEGGSVTLNGTYSDVGTADTHSISIDWGDGSAPEVVAVSGGTFSVNHTYVDDDPATGTASDVLTITVTLTDDDTGSDSDTVNVTVNNVAPTIDTLTTSVATVDEGTSFTLDGTFSDPAGANDTYLLDIDWDGDNTFDQTVAVSGGTFSVSHTYTDDNPTATPSDLVTIHARLRDDDLGVSGTSSTDITVANVDPSISNVAVDFSTVDEGDTVNLSFDWNDVGTADTISISIDWGDGSAPTVITGQAASGSFSGGHVYADDDPSVTTSDQYTISITVTDDDTGTTNDNSTVITVNNVDPVLVIPVQNITADEGVTLVTVNGTYSDVGVNDTHTLDVDWGDGTIDTGIVVTGGAFSVSHTFLDDNPSGTPSDTYTPIFTLHDDDSGFHTVTGPVVVTINNVAPTITGLSLTPANLVEGGTTTLNGTFFDPGTLDTYTLTIDWGDGSAPEVITGLTNTGTFSANHTYLDDNPTGTNSDLNNVVVTLTDDDTGTDTDSVLALISNVAPTLDSVTLTPSINENDSVTLAGTFSDPAGANDTYTLQVNWNDGSPLESFVVTGGSFSGITHQYLDDNPTGTQADTYSVTISLLDDDNGIAVATRNVAVLNVAPVVSITGAPGTSQEGTTINLGSTYSDVGTLDTEVSRTWSVTKNGVAFAAGSGVNFSFTPDDDGTYVVTLSGTDDDNGVGTDTATIIVSNVDPSLDSASIVPTTTTENGVVTLSGTYSDVGAADTHTLTIDWGDGSAPQIVTVSGGTFSGITHQYLDDNPSGTASDVNTVTLVLSDDDGGTDTGTNSVTVDNAPPTVSINGAPANSAEGTTINLTSTVADAGTLDTFTYAWSVTKNGNPFATGTAAGFSFTPDDNGTYVVSLTVTDDDTGVASAIDQTINVTNVSPTLDTLGITATVNENGVATLTGTYSDPGSADTHSLTINWGDGSAPEVVVISGGAFSITHTYLDDNPTGTPVDFNLVNVTLSDDDGGTDTGTSLIIVQNVAPVMNTMVLSPTVNEGGLATLSGTYSDVGSLDTHTITINWGDGSPPQLVAVSGGAFGPITHLYVDDNPTGTPSDNYTVTVTLVDDDGGSVVATAGLTVNNVAPTASIVGAPGSSPEGTAINLTSSVSDVGVQDTFTYAWSVTKDGNPYATGTSANFSFTPDDNGSYVVSLTVTDDDTGSVAAAPQTINVTNVNPVLNTLHISASTFENGTATLTGTYSDAGSADTHTLTINWGDGSAIDTVAVSGGSFSINHTYLDDNPTGTAFDFNTVNVTLTDDDSGSTTGSDVILVQNVAPVINTLVVTPSILENGTATLNGTYSDVGTQDTHSITINWGDGSAPQTFAVTGGAFGPFTHQYLDDNPSGTSNDIYTVTVTLTDDDTGSTVGQQNVLVNNVTPTVTIDGAPATSPEGTTINLTSTVTDPGTQDTFTYAWSVTKNGLPYSTGNSSTFSFTPDDNGLYVVNLTVSDDDLGIVAATSQAITVTNVDPVLTLNPVVASVNENGSVTVSGTYTDAGPADTHTMTIDWGDGTAPETFAVSGGTFTRTHTYLDDNPTGTPSDVNVISVTITDDDGGSDNQTANLTVNNVNPVATIVGAPATSNEGATINLSSTATDVGTLDTIVRTWSVTKNGNPYASGTGATFSFTPDDNGTYVVTLTATDDDTGVGTDVKTITVNNVAPTAGITGPAVGVTGQTLTYTLTATDSSPLDQAAGFTFNIDWDGDGVVDQTVTGPSGTQVTHVYTGTGSNTIKVTATDKDGGVSAQVTLPVTITDIAIIDGVLQVGGTTGNDVIVVKKRKHGDIEVIRNGQSLGVFNPVTDGITGLGIYGQAGNDKIRLPSSLLLPALIDGGTGNDNIKGGAGSDILIGGDGDDTITGRGGNDIIVGGNGSDYIHGQGGQDFIIGGDGADNLYGNGVGDLIIGGSTVYDNDIASLVKIQDEWTSDNSVLSVENRINDIKNGTGENDPVQLRPGIEATDDGDADKIHIKQGSNWVLTFLNDILKGKNNTDRVN